MEMKKYGAPAGTQRSGSSGERRSKGAGAVFAESRRLTAETELSGLCSDVVGVRGLEPRASCSQSRRATNCATPRYDTYPNFAHKQAVCEKTNTA